MIGLIFGITLTAMAQWAGTPTESANAFYIGILLLVIAVLTAGFIAWHLMIRPLPEGHKQPVVQPVSASLQRVVTITFSISMMCFVVGGFWDEVWHRSYGIPFGEDFFWRPHLLMYFGFSIVALLGFYGLYRINKLTKGTYQQRFRAHPVLAMLVFTCMFLVVFLPTDPIWHTIYGEDLTAWSLPHILVLVLTWLVVFVAVTVLLAGRNTITWRGINQLRGVDLLPIILYALLLMAGMIVITTDWDNDRMGFLNQLRPDWLLPVVVTSYAAFVGLVANRSLRMVGAASLVALLTLALRLSLIELFNAPDGVTAKAIIITLPVFFAVDIADGFMYYVRKRQPVWWLSALAAPLGFLVCTLPFLSQLYPSMDQLSIPITIVACALAGLVFGWAGSQIGNTIIDSRPTLQQAEAETQQTGGRLSLKRIPLAIANFGAIAMMAVFIAYFYITATPPI